MSSLVTIKLYDGDPIVFHKTKYPIQEFMIHDGILDVSLYDNDNNLLGKYGIKFNDVLSVYYYKE